MLQASNFKAIKIKQPFPKHTEFYKNDCNRIQSVLLDYGYYATLEQCAELWELYSEDWAAGWLYLPENNEDLYKCIKPYFEEV